MPAVVATSSSVRLSRWRSARILLPIETATCALLSSGKTIARQNPVVKISLIKPNYVLLNATSSLRHVPYARLVAAMGGPTNAIVGTRSHLPPAGRWLSTQPPLSIGEGRRSIRRERAARLDARVPRRHFARWDISETGCRYFDATSTHRRARSAEPSVPFTARKVCTARVLSPAM